MYLLYLKYAFSYRMNNFKYFIVERLFWVMWTCHHHALIRLCLFKLRQQIWYLHIFLYTGTMPSYRIVLYFSNWLINMKTLPYLLSVPYVWIDCCWITLCDPVFPQMWTGDRPLKPWLTWVPCSIQFVSLGWKTTWKTSGRWRGTMEAFSGR